ncbi:hypothetical protein D9M71_368210 [compost metagenome]
MLARKLSVAVVFAVLAIASQAGLAKEVFLAPTVSDATIVEHGGGCRKDSPQGQCCHAGSQPYHCH